jgi:hypothetical protein
MLGKHDTWLIGVGRPDGSAPQAIVTIGGLSRHSSLKPLGMIGTRALCVHVEQVFGSIIVEPGGGGAAVRGAFMPAAPG